MNHKIGIIRETKIGETRVSFTPTQLQKFIKTYEIPVFIESFNERCFLDEEYKICGVKIVKKLPRDCNVIFGFKEIPLKRISKDKIYFCFSHTAQGQKHNLPLLKKLIQKKSSLIDYEEIDRNYENSMRLGRYAGMVGIIEALSLLRERFEQENLYTMVNMMFLKPQEYQSIKGVKNHYQQISTFLSETYCPFDIPIVIGVVGNGRIANGIMEMLQELPYKIVDPECEIVMGLDSNYLHIAKFDRNYTSNFSIEYGDESNSYYFRAYLPYLTVLINAIKWNPDKDSKYITYSSISQMQRLNSNSRLKLIMDISCDLNGPIELVDKTTTFKNPYYIKNDIWISAIDNLPSGISDLAKESSTKVGNTLLSFFEQPLDLYTFFNDLHIYGQLSKAVIIKNGKITESFKNLKGFLK